MDKEIKHLIGIENSIKKFSAEVRRLRRKLIKQNKKGGFK